MEHSHAQAASQGYEDALAEMLALARSTLDDPTFGTDVDALAQMTAIPGVSWLLEEELLSIARKVSKRRRWQAA